jgi:hypothetical protein
MANNLMMTTMLKRLIHAGLMLAVMLGVLRVAPGHAADQPRLRWVVRDGVHVDRAQAERLYGGAIRAIERRFGAEPQAVRPDITIYVGELCPDPGVEGACLSPATAELYVPEWDAAAPAAVTQATLTLGLLRLMPPEELLDVTKTLLDEEARDFVDARTLAESAGD